MNTILRFLLAFFIITGVSSILAQYFHVPFGWIDFWSVHGVIFLVAIAVFPRLTLLLSGVPWGGLFWWLGWLFAPRVLVAVMATVAYWNTNKILVTISWLFAIGGESTEKFWIARHTKRRIVRRETWVKDGVKHETIDVEHKSR